LAVEGRAAGVSRVDGRSKLKEPLAIKLDLGTQDTSAHRVLQDEFSTAQARAAYDRDVLTTIESVGATQIQGGTPPRDRQQGQIAARILVAYSGLERSPVRGDGRWEMDLEDTDGLIGENVGVRRHDARTDNETGSGPELAFDQGD